MANKLFKTKLNEPSAEQLALPYYGLLPTDYIGLLKWKLYCRERALTDLEFREWFLQACAADVCFFAASLIWIHETRPIAGMELGKFPFMPDCDQADLLAWLAKYAGTSDMTCSKTRGIGLSYIVCILIKWLWLFHGESIEFAMVTKDLDSLDVKDRPSSLLGKLDLIFSELPAWMKVGDDGKTILNRTVTHHNFTNLRNGNVITGMAAGDDKLRSGRFYFVVLDEAAFFPSDVQRWIPSAQGATFSVLWLSTFDGTSNMFYRLSTNDDPNIDVVRLETFWEDNPRWAAGKYVSKNGIIEILDQTYKFPIDYTFSHDDPGLPRSPMVDAAFRRPGADKQRVKEEIYGLAVKDSRKLFSGKATLEIFDRCPIRHVWRGDYIDGQWCEDETGPVKLWVKPDCFTSMYAAGADPSLGSIMGAKAGFAVMDVKTGLYVLTARFEGLDAINFAQKCVAICKAICGPRSAGACQLAWESTGINFAFTGEVARLRYPSTYCEPGKDGRPGCHNQDKGEGWLLEMGRAITAKDAIIKCIDAINEFRAWEYDRKFDLIFACTEGHGDLGIACAITWRAGGKRRKAIIDQQKKEREKTANELKEYSQNQGKLTYSDRFGGSRRKRA